MAFVARQSLLVLQQGIEVSFSQFVCLWSDARQSFLVLQQGSEVGFSRWSGARQAFLVSDVWPMMSAMASASAACAAW